LNAKDRFLKSASAKPFGDMSGSQVFRDALDYATLELTERLRREDDANLAAFAHAKMTGALMFRDILEKLAVPEELAKTVKPHTLNYGSKEHPVR
jgi:hypothetical protein